MSDFFTNQYTENIQNEKYRHTLYRDTLYNIIVLITDDLIRCDISDFILYDIYLIHYNLKQRQIRFKSVRYRSAYSVIRQKKKGCSTVLTDTCNQKTINRNFEENLVLFECMKCCYLVIELKNVVHLSQTATFWKKLQNLLKGIFH